MGLLDDVPLSIKRARLAYSATPPLVESFAAERSEKFTAKMKAKGRGELNLKNLTNKQMANCQEALNREWSTWGKYDAVEVVLC